METSKDSFFNSIKLTAAQKAAGTHETAMRIIDDEVTARERKTARLRQLRQAQEAIRPPTGPKVRRAKAKPARVGKS